MKATADKAAVTTGVRKIPHLRWWITGLLFFSTAINYLDRQALSVLLPTLREELGLTSADYGTITTTLGIPAGNTTGTITVNPIADATVEADATVILTLAGGAGYTIGVPNAATGTILNDETPTLKGLLRLLG